MNSKDCISPIRARGLTLIELAIAMAVVALVLGLAIPPLQELLARQALGVGGMAWRDAHALARSHAIMQRVPTAICPSHDHQTCAGTRTWQQGWILFEDRDRNRARSPNERLLRVFNTLPNLDMRSTAGRQVLTYHPNGRADGSNLTMAICHARLARIEGRRLIMSNSGRFRTEPLDCARP